MSNTTIGAILILGGLLWLLAAKCVKWFRQGLRDERPAPGKFGKAVSELNAAVGGIFKAMARLVGYGFAIGLAVLACYGVALLLRAGVQWIMFSH